MNAILTYHSIDVGGSPISVAPETFASHLGWLTSGAVRVVPLDDLVQGAAGTDAVSVTFDDGFLNSVPALERLLDVGIVPTIFAVTGHAGEVTLVRPTDGAVLATWQTDTQAIDAVPVPHGVVSVDIKGTVRVGCLESAKIRTVAEVSSGSFGLIVQLVGDRIIVVDGGANPIRWATFANPCH